MTLTQQHQTQNTHQMTEKTTVEQTTQMTNFIIAHHNIRGLNHKLNDLKIYIQEHNPDIITLNETLKIKPNTKIYNYTITQPENNTGQGVCIIHKNNINIEILEPIQTTQPSTNLQHSIQITAGKDQIQITTLYCPRKNPLKETIGGIIQRNKNTIITGDFNSRHEELGHNDSDNSGRTLINTFHEHNYTKFNDDEPTYTNNRTGTQDVKDLIFSSPGMTKKFLDFWVGEDLGSDRNIINATFTPIKTQQLKPLKTIKLYHKANWKHINDTITTQMEDLQINNKSTRKDIDQYIDRHNYNNTG